MQCVGETCCVVVNAELHYCVFTDTGNALYVEERPLQGARREFRELCVHLIIFLTVRALVRHFTDAPWL